MSKKSYDYINPSHYKNNTYEVIDEFILLYGEAITAFYCEMNAKKYAARIGNKPNSSIEQDAKKKKWYEKKAEKLDPGAANRKEIISRVPLYLNDFKLK